MIFQALHHLLHCPVIHEGEGIDMAIKVVSEAKQEMLTQRLMDYLIGDLDATPKVISYKCLYNSQSMMEQPQGSLAQELNFTL